MISTSRFAVSGGLVVTIDRLLAKNASSALQ